MKIAEKGERKRVIDGLERKRRREGVLEFTFFFFFFFAENASSGSLAHVESLQMLTFLRSNQGLACEESSIGSPKRSLCFLFGSFHLANLKPTLCCHQNVDREVFIKHLIYNKSYTVNRCKTNSNIRCLWVS